MGIATCLAMSGIDCAVWDILAQAEGVPLYKALRGAGRQRVPVYASKVYTAPLADMAPKHRSSAAENFCSGRVVLAGTRIGGSGISLAQSEHESFGLRGVAKDFHIGLEEAFAADSVTRAEDPRLLRGDGQYPADVKLPNLAYAHFLRSDRKSVV